MLPTCNPQAIPKECYLNFNHPIMKSTYESISLYFEAVYSNVLVFHVYCNTAKQPILKKVALSVSTQISA